MKACPSLYIVLFGVSTSLTPVLASASDNWDPFLGVWEYRQRNQAAPSGVDPEGERLEIRRRGTAVVGLYFGLEREGEHGLFYTAIAVTNLSLDKQGTLSFVVPARQLFAKRPTSIEEAGRKRLAGVGFTRAELRMSGRLNNGRLTLTCVAERQGDCPEKELTFWKSR